MFIVLGELLFFSFVRGGARKAPPLTEYRKCVALQLLTYRPAGADLTGAVPRVSRRARIGAPACLRAVLYTRSKSLVAATLASREASVRRSAGQKADWKARSGSPWRRERRS